MSDHDAPRSSERNSVIGKVFGRWTVQRRAQPMKRRVSDNGARQRVVARCVCGAERVTWLEDLFQGRSNGCRSMRCRIRHAAVSELDPVIDRSMGGDARLRQLGARLKSSLRHWQVDARERDDAEERRRLDEQLSGEDEL